jgi:hypothetical protein
MGRRTEVRSNLHSKDAPLRLAISHMRPLQQASGLPKQNSGGNCSWLWLPSPSNLHSFAAARGFLPRGLSDAGRVVKDLRASIRPPSETHHDSGHSRF